MIAEGYLTKLKIWISAKNRKCYHGMENIANPWIEYVHRIQIKK